MEKEKVLLGMSGGVDSSVAALILKEKGYEVVGAFLKNFSDTKDPITGECSWIRERDMAEKIASKLDISLMTLDYEKEYKNKVIKPMFEGYKKGLTPNPDVGCNTIIKFPALIKKAKEIKAKYVSTGHYAKISKTKEGYSLKQGKDKTKDQTYFLYELTQKELPKILFPLANMTKEEVRSIAKKHNLPNWNKPGTRGICFVGNVGIKPFLKKKIKEKKGEVLSPEGKVIGTHPGIMFFTIHERIGPRHKIEIDKDYMQKNKEKLYIAEKRKNNKLIIAPKNHPILKRDKVKINRIKIINKKEQMPKNVGARIRHLGEIYKGKLKRENNKTYFKFNKRIEGLAEGQSIVLYNRSKVIGGGEIRL